MSAESLVRILRREGIRDEAVLAAIREVPRDAFVPEAHRAEAWANHPLPIGQGQTISQPYIVARMTELLDLEPGARVLEVGTGCGYQTAILVSLGARVYTIERLRSLSDRARETLTRVDRLPEAMACGDGWNGWPDEAPFDRILVTAAPERLPEALVDQLAVGGRLVIPVGGAGEQTLRVVHKLADDEVRSEDVAAVRFVPLVHGEAGDPVG